MPGEPPRPGAEEALGVTSEVVPERGRYVVYLDVVLVSGAVRRRISDWPDRERAEIAARELVRQAGRHITSPREPGDDAVPREP